MGIVLKQSFRNIIITYAGFGIGAVNALFLYTYFLTKPYYGVVSYVLSAANLIWPVLAFGVHNTLVKFYAGYQDRDQKDRFLTYMLLLPLGISFFCGFFGVFLYDKLLTYFNEGDAFVRPYVWTIFVIAFAMTYFEVFYAWVKVELKSVFGNFMKEIFHRVGATFLLVLVYFNLIEKTTFIYGLTVVYSLRMLFMAGYALQTRKPVIRLSLPSNWIPIAKYSILILLAGSVAVILLDLDKVMIKHYLPVGEVAVYGIMVYIASVIAVPSRAMHQITYPLTAQLLHQKDTTTLAKLYHQSSINLLIISGLVFLLIICNVEQLYQLIPPEYELVLGIIILLGAIKLYDSILGNNNSILFNSDYYRMVLLFGVVLALVAFILNILFIPQFGIMGAALATFLAIFLYNTVKLIFVYKKFKMHPFTYKTGWSLVVIGLFSGLFLGWSFMYHPLLNIVLKSVLLGISYTLIIYRLRLSTEINEVINSLWTKK
ncbi:hypothetical protein GCM10009117_02190 [Gangjinia marincola]|uniref:Polysaccharide biosynthesis protein n=1 Tax=Gangjinia marincola TaxID=578463 RepID=A0ABP3XTA9_9FLAO